VGAEFHVLDDRDFNFPVRRRTLTADVGSVR
jgi:hypothetical protein